MRRPLPPATETPSAHASGFLPFNAPGWSMRQARVTQTTPTGVTATQGGMDVRLAPVPTRPEPVRSSIFEERTRGIPLVAYFRGWRRSGYESFGIAEVPNEVTHVHVIGGTVPLGAQQRARRRIRAVVATPAYSSQSPSVNPTGAGNGGGGSVC